MQARKDCLKALKENKVIVEMYSQLVLQHKQEEEEEGTFDDGVSVGGTSAYDDYDADVEGGDSITTTGTTTNATRYYYNWRRGKPINIRGKRQHTRSMHSIASWRHSRCPHVLGYGSECIR